MPAGLNFPIIAEDINSVGFSQSGVGFHSGEFLFALLDGSVATSFDRGALFLPLAGLVLEASFEASNLFVDGSKALLGGHDAMEGTVPVGQETLVARPWLDWSLAAAWSGPGSLHGLLLDQRGTEDPSLAAVVFRRQLDEPIETELLDPPDLDEALVHGVERKADEFVDRSGLDHWRFWC